MIICNCTVIDLFQVYMCNGKCLHLSEPCKTMDGREYCHHSSALCPGRNGTKSYCFQRTHNVCGPKAMERWKRLVTIVTGSIKFIMWKLIVCSQDFWYFVPCYTNLVQTKMVIKTSQQLYFPVSVHVKRLQIDLWLLVRHQSKIRILRRVRFEYNHIRSTVWPI